jgi:predicted nucleotidyltransferase
MIKLPRKEIATFCRTHHIAKLSVFGSALTEDFGPDSDVDFLVEFEPGHVPGLIRFAGMELELTAIIGRKADLRTPAELSKYFRDDVMAAAIVQYAR